MKGEGKTQTAERKSKPPANPDELLSQRMQSGPLPVNFEDLVSVLNVAHDISIVAKNNCIENPQMHWPFPESYAPTVKQLLDAIARQTQTHWRPTT
jgi:hypothetical protein